MVNSAINYNRLRAIWEEDKVYIWKDLADFDDGMYDIKLYRM
jgi:hypothetical protein